METRHQRQILLAQNFLKDARLVSRLVGMSTIGPSDTVYEIGPGNGIITVELARIAERVIAIEKDPILVRRLRQRFRAHANVEIVEKDFLAFCIPQSEYKMFASIPYNTTARIIRKVLYERPAPSEAYLILQKEAAKKFSGCPRETLFSVLAKPFFELEILARLRRTDFSPAPSVDSVLLAIRRRRIPLIESQDANLYRQFVDFGFSRWKPNLKLAYKHVFNYKQWKRIARDLRFPLNASPTDLSFEQWLGLFDCFNTRK
jgi:23S rRNA (adenine-N6)-dimethyltransferase